VLEERLDARVSAAKRAVERSHFLRVPAREDHVAEALAILARHPAMLFEPLERVVVQYLTPQVCIVSRAVTAAPDVGEVARAVARRHEWEVHLEA
jgi:hypothetical protein